MKRFIVLLVAFCMVFSLCACGDLQNVVSVVNEIGTSRTESASQNGSTAKIGDVLQEPEKTISFADLTALTLTVKGQSTMDSGSLAPEITIDCVYSTADDLKIYWVKSDGESFVLPEGNIEPYYEDLYCAVKGGQEYAFVSLNEDGTDEETAVGEVLGYLLDFEATSNEQLMKELFAYYGIDYVQNYYYKNVTFEKCADETVNGFDCYVYNILSDDDSVNYEKIYVDKVSGLWIKDELSWDEDGTTYVEIFEIVSYSFDDSALPDYLETKFN